MNALELLEADHRKVRALLSDMEGAGNGARAELFDRVRNEMQIHEAVEEQIFYLALTKHSKVKEIVLEGYEEHHVVDEIISELERVDPDDERWTAKFKVLKDSIEHNIREEEHEIFRRAREYLGDEELGELGFEMELKRDELHKFAD